MPPRLARSFALAAVAFTLAVPGCGGWRGYGDTYYGRKVPKKRARRETTYRFEHPGGEWRPVRESIDGVQVAWLNPELVGVIEIHGQCDEQGDSSLHQYVDHIRIDWTDWTVQSEAEGTFAGRDSLRVVAQGKLDGVARRSEMLLFKKNGCLFDLRYSADPPKFERGRAAFGRVVDGFEFPIGE